MEQVFFRLHVRAVTIAGTIFGQKAIFLLEKISLVNAFTLLFLLVSLHTTFVNPPSDSYCLVNMLGDKLQSLKDYDVIKLHVSNDICVNEESEMSSQYDNTKPSSMESNFHQKRQHTYERFVDMLGLHYDDSPRAKLAMDSYGTISFPGWKGGANADGLKRAMENILGEDSGVFASASSSIVGGWNDNENDNNNDKTSPSFTQQTSESQSQSQSQSPQSQSQFWSAVAEAQLYDVFMSERVYLYSKDKGYLMLRSELRDKHNITRIDITVPKQGSCFGTGPVSWIIHNVIGYDTVVMNWMIAQFGGKGYLYNVYTKEMYNLNLATEFRESSGRANRVFFFKIGILFTTLFLFFTTTTLVSFTLRETQERMLKFTYLLQHHVRHRIPYAPLVLTHVVESLVFVPIMVGILFFLFEFFSDQLLAFMVLSLVWMAEVFSVVSVRTLHSVRFFPRVFFLYFCIFHFYFFSFPFGFSYVALFTTVLFLQHSLLFCWNHYEVPAIETGRISAFRPRATSTAIPWAPSAGPLPSPSPTSEEVPGGRIEVAGAAVTMSMSMTHPMEGDIGIGSGIGSGSGVNAGLREGNLTPPTSPSRQHVTGDLTRSVLPRLAVLSMDSHNHNHPNYHHHQQGSVNGHNEFNNSNNHSHSQSAMDGGRATTGTATGTGRVPTTPTRSAWARFMGASSLPLPRTLGVQDSLGPHIRRGSRESEDAVVGDHRDSHRQGQRQRQQMDGDSCGESSSHPLRLLVGDNNDAMRARRNSTEGNPSHSPNLLPKRLRTNTDPPPPPPHPSSRPPGNASEGLGLGVTGGEDWGEFLAIDSKVATDDVMTRVSTDSRLGGDVQTSTAQGEPGYRMKQQTSESDFRRREFVVFGQDLEDDPMDRMFLE
eukprot:gene10174-21207_t